jgi:hypothetical protein
MPPRALRRVVGGDRQELGPQPAIQIAQVIPELGEIVDGRHRETARELARDSRFR